MKWSCQNDDFQFAGKVKKKYGYALRDFECLFYEGFSGKIVIVVLCIIVKIRGIYCITGTIINFLIQMSKLTGLKGRINFRVSKTYG